MSLNYLQGMIEEIEESSEAENFPDEFWDDIIDVKNWEVYSLKESLPVLANSKVEDEFLQLVINDIYINGKTIASVYEFSQEIAKNPDKTPAEGPLVIESDTETKMLSIFPVWDKRNDYYVLSLNACKESFEAVILVLTKDKIKNINLGEAIFENVKKYVEKFENIKKEVEEVGL